MPVDVLTEILIERPLEEVGRYEWKTSPPLRQGSMETSYTLAPEDGPSHDAAQAPR